MVKLKIKIKNPNEGTHFKKTWIAFMKVHKMHKVMKWFQKGNLYINNHGHPLSTQHVNDLWNNEND